MGACRRAGQLTVLAALTLPLPGHEPGETAGSPPDPKDPQTAGRTAVGLLEGGLLEGATLPASRNEHHPTTVPVAPIHSTSVSASPEQHTPPVPLTERAPPGSHDSGFLRRTFPHPDDPWPEALAKGVFNVLTGIGAFAAWRGFRKLREEIKERRRTNADVRNGCFIRTPSLSLHTFYMDGDRQLMDIRARKTHPLNEIFPLPIYAEVFEKAARRCTADNPFPLLQLPEILSEKNVRRSHRFGSTHLPSLKSMTGVSHKFLINFASDELGDQANDLRAAAGLKVARYRFYIIPIAEVSPAKSTLVLAAITERDFNRFGDAEFVDTLRRDCPRHFHPRINQLALAYRLQTESLEQSRHTRDSNGRHEGIDGLFPIVVVLRKPTKERRPKKERGQASADPQDSSGRIGEHLGN